MGLFDFFWPCKTDSDTFGADVPFTTEPHPFDTIGYNSYDSDTSSSDPYGSNSFGSDPFGSDGF